MRGRKGLGPEALPLGWSKLCCLVAPQLTAQVLGIRKAKAVCLAKLWRLGVGSVWVCALVPKHK